MANHHNIETDAEIKKDRDGPLSLTATSDDIRQFRDAVAGDLTPWPTSANWRLIRVL
jgi:hypothetical protein